MNATTSGHGREFRPGETASATGVYRATHLRHRMPHEITVLQGEELPRCKKCGEKVRFELVHEAPRFKGDIDLLLGISAVLTLVCCAFF